ncbi:MAG: HAMP domain-containing sensor histidine kinase [Anaerolineales bacterium]|nr:MAG: HAMP domain-containing sensor histidine kinase [Anaerolineales bacterium]
MSIRDRLTLFNIVLLGGLFIFFGVVSYSVVTILLYNQIDNALQRTSEQIVSQVHIDVTGAMGGGIVAPSLRSTSNIFVQVWDTQQLVDYSPNLGNFNKPLDSVGIRKPLPSYRDVTLDDSVRLRVLSVPLVSEGRRVGVVQVAATLDVVDSARRNLLSVLAFTTILGIAISALASQASVKQFLLPLDTIASAADQINRADDLSRRVPYEGSDEDEIGQLVHAVNQTFERLEVLFTSQQRFIADVSHELRTPLTVIKGNVDLMRRMRELDPDLLDSIDQEAGRLTRLVTDLLLLAKAEAGSLPLTKASVELDTLLLEVIPEMRVLAGNKIRVKLTEIDQLQVYGDRDRLKQVLLNLIANAIQYTPAGEEVFLSLARVGDRARLIVRDTGPGIPAEDLPYIFERFYRAEKSRTRSAAGGFGLGLSIAHWIVEQHGGRIEVNSREGWGTTFAVWLPLAK